MSLPIVLFDDFEQRKQLLPLVASRPIGNLRIGTSTLDQKWRYLFSEKIYFKTVDYLQHKFDLPEENQDSVFIRGGVLPSQLLLEEIESLDFNQVLINTDNQWIAARTSFSSTFKESNLTSLSTVTSRLIIEQLAFPEDIFLKNANQIVFDVNHVLILSSYNKVYPGTNNVYSLSQIPTDTVFNTEQGPVVIGADTVIEAGVIIHGPCSIGDFCRIKSGTVLYPNVSIGNHSTICGELNNCVIWGNSAKGHYGYLGCAVVGEGCNLGAGTTNSNLKNDWSTVKLYDYSTASMRDTGLIKCGVVIGDHVMLGINSKINTGTVIGVGAQIAMSNFIPKFVPDFTWCTEKNSESYIFARFIQMLERKAKIKGEQLLESDIYMLQAIFENTDTLRRY